VAGLVSSLGASYEKLLLAEFGLIALAILLPATLLGAVFPFACRLAGASEGAVGRTVGAVYTWNTLGSIAGTLVASFALVPTIGLSATIRWAATLNLGLAATLLARSPGTRRGMAIAPAFAVLIAWILPSWSASLLTSGSYLYGKHYADRAREEKVSLGSYVENFPPPEAQYWDAYGLASVHRQGPILTLRVNGKPDASTGEMDMLTQLFVGHVPLLHHPAPRRVLVIGLGAGVTLGAVVHYDAEKIDCVEISSAVKRAAGHFNEVTGNPLQDRRVRYIHGDGRNLVRFTKESYDVIISEPSNLWVSGMANLFTKEFFEEVRGRLAPGGVFCQWMCAYRVDPEDFRLVLRTFYSVYPEGSVWEVTPGGDYLFLGGERPRPLPFAELERRFALPFVRKDLEDPDLPGPIGFVGHLVMEAPDARSLAADGPVVTDDRLTLEYTAPRSALRTSQAALLTFLDRARERDVAREHFADLTDDLARRIARRRADRRQFARSVIADEQGRFDVWLRLVEEIRPEGRDRFVVGSLISQATKRLGDGDIDGCIRSGLLVPRSSPQWGDTQLILARAHRVSGRRAEAAACYRNAVSDPTAALDAFVGLAQLSQENGRTAEATGYWREAVRMKPDLAELRLGLVSSLMQEGRFPEAREACQEALRRDPNHVQARKILEALERR
jgi:spermidine synthase